MDVSYDRDGVALVFGVSSGSPRWDGDNVFVCGGLQSPERMGGLLGRTPAFAVGVVTGFERTVERRDGRDIPFMATSADAAAPLTGVVWLDLTSAERAAVEGFELAGAYRKAVEVVVTVGERAVAARTYVRR